MAATLDSVEGLDYQWSCSIGIVYTSGSAQLQWMVKVNKSPYCCILLQDFGSPQCILSHWTWSFQTIWKESVAQNTILQDTDCQHILIPWRCVCSLRAIGCLYIAMLSLQTRSVSPFGRVHPLIPRSPQFSHVIHKPGDFMHRNEKKWHKEKEETKFGLRSLKKTSSMQIRWL